MNCNETSWRDPGRADCVLGTANREHSKDSKQRDELHARTQTNSSKKYSVELASSALQLKHVNNGRVCPPKYDHLPRNMESTHEQTPDSQSVDQTKDQRKPFPIVRINTVEVP
eukprot:c8186_g1_i1.p1 GENE.c8186_g1_i1~~c8186_g1_i1.p1  ORF type:complete len:113 (+),score=3.25 c8186_g1_i1:909-1247(+)